MTAEKSAEIAAIKHVIGSQICRKAANLNSWLHCLQNEAITSLTLNLFVLHRVVTSVSVKELCWQAH